eukprot:13243897-Alexandrium_andersonii.AAC.1
MGNGPQVRGAGGARAAVSQTSALSAPGKGFEGARLRLGGEPCGQPVGPRALGQREEEEKGPAPSD